MSGVNVMLTQQKPFQRGDSVIFEISKTSSRPGPRAQNVRPALRGDTYRYTVEKCWIVDEILSADLLLLRTRRGKTHAVAVGDRRLKHPSLWQQMRYRNRFRAVRAGRSGKSVAEVTAVDESGTE